MAFARSHKTVTVVNGAIETIGGTSASAPIFASLIAAVNDARIAAGKSPVGFINPAVRLTGCPCARSLACLTVRRDPRVLNSCTRTRSGPRSTISIRAATQGVAQRASRPRGGGTPSLASVRPTSRVCSRGSWRSLEYSHEAEAET